MSRKGGSQSSPRCSRMHAAGRDYPASIAAPSIIEPARAAACLDVATAFLAFQPALLGAERRPGRAARRRAHHGFAKQLDQTFDRISAIPLLGAEALGMDDDDAVLGHALAGKALQPGAGVLRQHHAARVEAQLGRGRELVDILPAGAGGADKADLEIVLVDGE